MKAEGSPCANNPLDTTENYPGATDCNKVGVKNYASFTDGLKATATTLNLNMNGYAAIRDGLKSGADPISIGQAIASSAWGTGKLALECITDAANSPSTFASWAAKTIPGSGFEGEETEEDA